MTPSETLTMHKMQTNGNVFIVLWSQHNQLSTQNIQLIAHQAFGIGCDQILLLSCKDQKKVLCEFYNRDGSRAALCLNGVYAIANFIHNNFPLYDYIVTKHASFEIKNDHNEISVQFSNNILNRTQRMQPPYIPNIPEITSMDMVNVGNQHLLIQVKEPDTFPLHKVAQQPAIMQMFPDGINISAYTTANHGHLKMRTHERGAGITLGCGSAGLALYILQRSISSKNNKQVINQPGGHIQFQQHEETISMQAEYGYTAKVEFNAALLRKKCSQFLAQDST